MSNIKARQAFWDAALGNNSKLANLAKMAIKEAEDEALAKQEPVAWMMLNSSGDEISITESNLRHHQPAFVQELWKDAKPLYTTPYVPTERQQRKPLTQQEVVDGFCEHPHDVQFVSVFDAGVRFAEAAHGIKE